MGEKPCALVRLNSIGLGIVGVALITVLGDGIGNSVVEAAVQGAQFIHLKRRTAFDCQIGDRLAQVAIIMHDLVDRQPERQQVLSMLRGRGAERR